MFKNYQKEDYLDLCNFLIEININQKHINWNWARFEWMYEHPMFDKSLLSLIYLWIDNDKVVGTAIYDMFLGEASILVLPDYYHLYSEILDYAFKNLKDE